MSDKAQHTPGPWRKARSLDRLNAHDTGIACSGAQTVLAECYAEFWAKGEVRPAECEANANLIVAAPDLLAACEALLPHVHGEEMRGMLTAAIAKARGQS